MPRDARVVMRTYAEWKDRWERVGKEHGLNLTLLIETATNKLVAELDAADEFVPQPEKEEGWTAA